MSALASQVIPSPPDVISSSSVKTCILIITDNPPVSRAVATSLRALNFDVMLCLFDGRTLSSTPVKAPDAILCHLTDYIEMSPKIAKVIRHHFAPRILPVIGALSRPVADLETEFDSTVFEPVHASQIANRVNSMIRLGFIESEINRRIATLQEDFGETVELGDLSPDRPFRVLFIGKASPAFMVIINALQDKGVEVVAAFTSFSAFDYLEGDPFDAVVMNALEQSEPALSISETMRKNSRLYHVPTLFLVQEPFSDREAAYERGARDIIDVNSKAEEIRGRILELANYHRVHEQMKRDMFNLVTDKCQDQSGTVFSRQFFDAHLSRLVSDAASANQSISLMGLQLLPNSSDDITEAEISAAMIDAGVMIQDMIRMQDMVCRHEDSFLLAFYDMSDAQAHIVLDRLRSLLESASFSTSPRAALTLSTRSTLHQIQPHQSAQDAIRTLLHELEHAPY